MSVSVMIGKMLKILLVDDSEFILQRVQHLLAGMEQIQEVRTATSAEEANQWIEAYNPSLIFLDINLPGKNGLQMLKDIRANKSIDPIVVILTNNTLSGYRNECMQAGADYFLDKAKDFSSIPDIIVETAEKFSFKDRSN
ncbi:MAG: response regulator [Sediminibacterium sp. Gen4]|jgi:CheY-like chemotaxis protein|uniref:response regulator n=1 Tax=unclassified Sediminibacterium TaxID=2635961 RepID=UPI0015BF0062|nr:MULTISPECIES: response regulator [unclassified Sediminibacterium]MBW0161609.1 response regulator [Sediminibacterium sp.]MBW0165817.1 response regulator [Sediminibacterium sp.]NWK64784.1 response regulator [Sediminibacterium sp. Gen4]